MRKRNTTLVAIVADDRRHDAFAARGECFTSEWATARGYTPEASLGELNDSRRVGIGDDELQLFD